MTGCASSGFDPTSIIKSDSPVVSAIVLVMAPEPSVIARPATDGECQTRAQLSTLLLPNPQRTSFCIIYISSFVEREHAKPAKASVP